MPKRNYGFEKRQKELNRQQKRAEKAQRKLERVTPTPDAKVEQEPPPRSE